MLVELTLLNGDNLAVNPDCVVSFHEDPAADEKCVKLNVNDGECYFIKGDYRSVAGIIGVNPPYVF